MWSWDTWWVIVAPSHGMRVLQVGCGERTFLWNALRPSSEMWCIGGNRTWLAPEFSNKTARRPGLFELSNGGWEVPSGLDPGPYEGMRLHDNVWRGGTTVSTQELHLSLTREIRIRPPRIEERPVLVIDVASTLATVEDGPAPIDVGLWSITQVVPRPGAYAAVPARHGLSGPMGELPATPMPETHSRDGALTPVRFSLRTGYDAGIPEYVVDLPNGRFFKVGFGPDDATGSIRYFTEPEPGIILSVEQTNSRLVPFSEEHRYVDFGDVVQVFNSSEDQGPFAEIETHHPAIPVPNEPGVTGMVSLVFSVSTFAAPAHRA